MSGWLGATAALACTPSREAAAADREAIEVRPWPRTRAVPSFALPRLDDEAPFALEAWRGSIVLLNFWASWCEPCTAEMASLDALAAEGGVRVLGVDFKQSADAIRDYLARHPVRYPIVRDAQGAAAKAWTDGVLPTTVILDASGRPRVSVLGELDWTGERARGIIRSVPGRR